MWEPFVLLAFAVLISAVGIAWLHVPSLATHADFSRFTPAHWHRMMVLDLRLWSVWYLRCALVGGAVSATLALNSARYWHVAAASCLTFGTWLFLRRETAWAARQRSFTRIPVSHSEGTPVA